MLFADTLSKATCIEGMPILKELNSWAMTYLIFFFNVNYNIDFKCVNLLIQSSISKFVSLSVGYFHCQFDLFI